MEHFSEFFIYVNYKLLTNIVRFLRFFVNIISDEMLQNLENLKIFKINEMRNFGIFQNSLVQEVLREDVNFPNISEYFWKMFQFV